MSATAEEIAEVLVLRLREERESEVRVFTSEQMANYLQVSQPQDLGAAGGTRRPRRGARAALAAGGGDAGAAAGAAQAPPLTPCRLHGNLLDWQDGCAGCEAELRALAEEERPKTRAECQGTARPCPWVGCKWHLLEDQLRMHKGRRAWQFLGADEGVALLEELPESCALDVAERGDSKLEEIGKLLRLTRERVRQIEINGAARLGLAPLLKEIDDDGP